MGVHPPQKGGVGYDPWPNGDTPPPPRRQRGCRDTAEPGMLQPLSGTDERLRYAGPEFLGPPVERLGYQLFLRGLFWLGNPCPKKG